MCQSIEDKDKDIELKDNKINYIAGKIGISDMQCKQEMEQVNLTQFLNKADKFRKKLDRTLKKHRQINY